MRIFVLSPGRCGSTTLSKALAHATNYTCGHETRSTRVENRLDYPDQHIEIDNRLSFFLGPLYQRYPDAFYVWLRRDREAVVRSYMKRFRTRAGIMSAFAQGIIQDPRPVTTEARRRAVAELYVDTTEANIAAFLSDTAPRQAYIEIDGTARVSDFVHLWKAIGAEGDLRAAQNELKARYNAS